MNEKTCEIEGCNFKTASAQVMRKHMNTKHQIKKRAGRPKEEGAKTQKELSDHWYSQVKDLMRRERAFNKARKKPRRGKWFAVWKEAFKRKLGANTALMYKLDGLPNGV